MSISISAAKDLGICKSQAIEVTLYDRISEFPLQDFLRFVPENNALMQPSYLQLLEEKLEGNMQFLYVAIRQEGVLCGIAYFQVVRFTGNNVTAYFPTDFGSGILAKVKAAAVKLSANLVARIDVPILVSGNLFITGEQGLYLSSHFTERERSYYLAATINEILRKRVYLKAVLLPDMYEPAGDFDAAFLDHYLRIEIESDMNMCLPQTWHSFDDYLMAISSKYRVRAKKILSTTEAITCHEMDAVEIEDRIDRIYELYKIVADKADFNIAKFPGSYYPAQKKVTPEIYRVFGYFLEGRLIGFMSYFVLPYKTEVHYCGIDYEVNKGFPLYQRMLYDTVRFGVENRVRKLHFGRTAPEVKSTIGAVPQAMYGYVKHRNSIVNFVLSLFTSRLKPRTYILRNPFKA